MYLKDLIKDWRPKLLVEHYRYKWYNNKMAKNVAPNRVPSQNIVTGVIPVIASNDPLKIFLRRGSYIETDINQENLYAQYIASPSTTYDLKVKTELSDLEKSELLKTNLVFDSVDLSSIENVTSEIYYDSLGNPKVKYILKVRNSNLDKDNVVGVDARIYNPFA